MSPYPTAGTVSLRSRTARSCSLWPRQSKTEGEPYWSLQACRARQVVIATDLAGLRERTSPYRSCELAPQGERRRTHLPCRQRCGGDRACPVSYTHLRAHETGRTLVC